MKNNLQETNKTDRKYVNILGINILSTNSKDLLIGITRNISSSIKFSILTPNPELVLASTKNPQLRNALNSCDFAVADGVGLAYASKFLYGKDLEIIPGRILFEKLIKLASEKDWKVFLLGGMGDEAEHAAEKLALHNSKIKIQYAGGSKVTPDLSKEVVSQINKFSPDFLFVAFGNPKQEIFINENLGKLNVRCMMAVGGTFRYVAGLSPLPPKWMEECGLEWLWRLITEPYRFGRIFRASIIFPLRLLWYKVTKN